MKILLQFIGVFCLISIFQPAANAQNPTVTSFTPSKVGPGDIIQIFGTNFLTNSCYGVSDFQGPMDPLGTTDTKITCRAAFGTPGSGKIGVYDNLHDTYVYASTNIIYDPTPIINSVTPLIVNSGDTITVKGKYLAPNPNGFFWTPNVTVGGISASFVQALEDSIIKVIIPVGYTGGSLVITSVTYNLSAIFPGLIYNQPGKVNIADSLALVNLYNSTGGAAWINKTNWLTSAPLSTWYGVGINSLRVTSLNLINNHLVNNIPTSFGNLTALFSLYLDNNSLTGYLPSSINNLLNLKTVHISNNQLTGNTALFKLKDSFYLQNNKFNFEGLEEVLGRKVNACCISYAPQAKIKIHTIDNKLYVSTGGSLNNNTYKWYRDNILIATINGDSTYQPTSSNTYSVIVNNSIVTGLTLYSDTVFVDPIRMQDSLALVDLYNSTLGASWVNKTNWLSTAPINAWYGITLTAGRVTQIILYNNNLRGNIPSSIGTLTNLTTLNLRNNWLNGNLPIEIGYLLNLQTLSLYSNEIVGNIPTSIGNLSQLRYLDFNENLITGEIPATIGLLSNLNYLDFSFNQLTGNIPTAIINNTSLHNLFLNDNQLTGKIPSLPLKDTIIIKNNNFNFDGLEEIVIKKPNAGYVQYSPQAKIGIYQKQNKLYVSAGGSLNNNTYKWYNGSTLVATIKGDSTYRPITTGKYSAVVTNNVVSHLTLYSDSIVPSNFNKPLCSSGNSSLTSSLTGTQYQWQQSIDGINFTNLANNANFSGVTSQTILLNNIPSAWYGYQYRCLVNGNSSSIYTLWVTNNWIGAGTTPQNSAWENPLNWSCGSVPDSYTDVVINNGNVIVGQNSFCRTLTITSGANVVVNSGITLNVKY